MNTHIVHFLPRGEHSHTKKLLDAFKEAAKFDSFEDVDLTHEHPHVLNKDAVLAYIERNYLGEKLDDERRELMRQADHFCHHLKDADAIVLAFPMHNFSLPAVVKAWFDSVMQNGETFSIDEDGYHGKLKAKKAIIFMASGNIYSGANSAMNHATTLAEQELRFMGVEDIKIITAEGMNLPDGLVEEREEAAIKKATAAGKSWQA